MRLAVLDIGSNTAHAQVVDGEPDGTFKPIAEQRAVLKLAEAAFPSMVLPDEAIGRLINTVSQMRAFAAERSAEEIVDFATSAIREATNGMEVLGRVRQATGVHIKVLPGVDEARLTYLAARAWAAFSAARPRAEAHSMTRQIAIVEFARGYEWDEPHARQVADLAVSLFDQLGELHQLSAAERELLYFAGLLHDVGAASRRPGKRSRSSSNRAMSLARRCGPSDNCPTCSSRSSAARSAWSH